MNTTSDKRQTDRRISGRRLTERREELITGFLAFVGTTQYTMRDIDSFLDAVLGPDSCAKRFPSFENMNATAKELHEPRNSDRRDVDRRVNDRRKFLIIDFLAYVGSTKYTELDIDEFLDDVLGPVTLEPSTKEEVQ